MLEFKHLGGVYVVNEVEAENLIANANKSRSKAGLPDIPFNTGVAEMRRMIMWLDEKKSNLKKSERGTKTFITRWLKDAKSKPRPIHSNARELSTKMDNW